MRVSTRWAPTNPNPARHQDPLPVLVGPELDAGEGGGDWLSQSVSQVCWTANVNSGEKVRVSLSGPGNVWSEIRWMFELLI